MRKLQTDRLRFPDLPFLTALKATTLAVLICALGSPASAPAAGVTIITHGLQGNVGGWILPMAEAISGTNTICYEIRVRDNGAGGHYLTYQKLGGPTLTSSPYAEIIIKLDWSDFATVFSLATSTTDIATWFAPLLLTTNSGIPEFAGRTLVDFPVHLIGHSRGGSVVSEVARLLGASGVWIDHITFLDPHPVSLYGDAPVYVFENVLFAESYYQDIDLITDGQPVFGAYNRRLTSLAGAYNDNHKNVHVWYHGTIDRRIPTSYYDADDGVSVTITATMRQNWWSPYEAAGDNAGFGYTLIRRGNRLSSAEPAGPGSGRIRDGYNQLWDFGAGVFSNRYALPANNGSWPNLIQFKLIGSNSVAQGELVTLKYFRQNTQTATVTIFLDTDFNPYNGNAGQVAQFTESGLNLDYAPPRQFSFATSATPPRDYAMFAKITAGGRSRYLYTPEVLTVRPPPCSYSISPTESSHVAGVSSGSVTVTTRSDCDWTASSSCEWVQITAGASGLGNGSVTYSVEANPSCAPRTCNLTIAGQTFAVRQQGGTATFTISPPDASHGPGAEAGTVTVTASSLDCTWSATANCGWLHITAGATGVGNGVTSYAVDPNPNCISRTCMLTVAGKTFLVNQAAGSGTFMISPSSRNHGSGPASGNVSVTTGIGCDWTAMSNDGWISVTVGATGTGNGTVSYSLEANADSMTRTGTVSVAGSMFIVTQAGDTTRPFVTITGPPANARFTNDQITLSGTASDDRAVARVEYQLGTNQPQTASGTTNWTAALELVPGTNMVQVRCFDLAGNFSTNSTRSFYFSRVSLTKGSYTGLFHEPDAVRFHSSGFFRLVVTDKATYSGSLLSGGKTYSITGRFNPDGTATNMIVRNGANVLGVTWALDMQGLNAVSGTVNGPNWQATLAGDRAQLNAITNPAWQAGKYTLVIAGHEGATNEPAGDGFGTATVDRNGKVKLSGTLAEGTRFVQSVPTSKAGRWPLFTSLYTTKGAALSWLSFDPADTNRLTGTLNWFKPSLPASKFYTNGFSITNSIFGSRFVPPVGATNRILSITNGAVVFSGANRLESITNAVALGLNSKVTNASGNKLTLTFALASGLFSGTFTEAGTTTRIPFKGAVLQNVNNASGYFLDTNRSGRVFFQGNQ